MTQKHWLDRVMPPSPESFSHGVLVEMLPSKSKRPRQDRGRGSITLPRVAVAAQVALPQSLILRRNVEAKSNPQSIRQHNPASVKEFSLCSNNYSRFDPTIPSHFDPPPTERKCGPEDVVGARGFFDDKG